MRLYCGKGIKQFLQCSHISQPKVGEVQGQVDEDEEMSFYIDVFRIFMGLIEGVDEFGPYVG